MRRAGFGWSDRPDDGFRRRDRERVVAGALIQEELACLRDESFDLDLIGFDATEPERLLALAHGEAGSDDAEDEVPEPPEDPVTHPGDLLILGNHRLLCGDAPKDKLRSKHRPIMNDNLGSGFEAFLYEACVNVLSVTKGGCYICMSSSELHTLQRRLRPPAASGRPS